MARTIQKIIELQKCRFPPSTKATTTDLSLPLTQFDMEWLNFHPINRLLFYEFPCTATHFTDSIVPNLKKSLSRTLNHYLPLSGNLIYPLKSSSQMPEFRYRLGDSISLTIAESSRVSDLNCLSKHQIKGSDEFYCYVPKLPPDRTESSYRVSPLLALQVTLFPNTGICIGSTMSHAIGDASTYVNFTKLWSSIAKFDGDEQFLASEVSKPFYDRSVIQDPNGMAVKHWNHVRMREIESQDSSFVVPTNRVRATYVLTRPDIEKLKGFVMDRSKTPVYLSSFTIVSAYVWTCLVKSESAIGERIDDDEIEYFGFTADARGRCNPPLPETYFGNCLAIGLVVESTRGELKGGDGFFIAAKLIGDIIRKRVNNREEIFKCAEEWLAKYEFMAGKRIFGVAESPKFDVYDADYGWGRPKKFESVSIDRDRYSLSLVKSRDFEGGLEIGLSLPVKVMNAFAGIFADGLKNEVLYIKQE